MPLLFGCYHVLPLAITHVIYQPEATEMIERFLILRESNFAASILRFFLNGLDLEEFV